MSLAEDPRFPLRLARDGKLYTIAEFLLYYGVPDGFIEWTAAREAKTLRPEKRLFERKQQRQHESGAEKQEECRSLVTLCGKEAQDDSAQAIDDDALAIEDIREHELEQAETAVDPRQSSMNLIAKHGTIPPSRICRSDSLQEPSTPRLEMNENSRREDEIREMSKIIWKAFPAWMPIDLITFESNLVELGITNVTDLQREFGNDLQCFSDAMTRLKETRKTKGTDALGSLREQLDAEGSSEKELSIVASKSTGRLLCDLLWEARPTWKAFSLYQAHRKLVKVGIHSVELLRTPLRTNTLNQKLQDRNFRPFSNDTVNSLRRTLYFISGDRRDSLNSEDKLEEWLHAGTLPRGELRKILWESRPTWTMEHILRVEAKLAKVDVHNVSQFAEALDGDIVNSRLRKVGEKPFSEPTISAFRRRVWIPSRLPLPSIINITEESTM